MPVSISHCSFTNLQNTPETAAAVVALAKAIEANAKALEANANAVNSVSDIINRIGTSTQFNAPMLSINTNPETGGWPKGEEAAPTDEFAPAYTYAYNTAGTVNNVGATYDNSNLDKETAPMSYPSTSSTNPGDSDDDVHDDYEDGDAEEDY